MPVGAMSHYGTLRHIWITKPRTVMQMNLLLGSLSQKSLGNSLKETKVHTPDTHKP